jgi:MFS family permease
MMEKQVLVIFSALLLDILAFTLILPLFPRLMDHYKHQYEQGQDAFFGICMQQIQTFKHLIGASGAKLDIVLLGGAMGSLFALLQFISSPWIGRWSDRYGRKTTLLWTMTGNILSALLWVFAGQFYIFVLARIVGGLSEGNVQLSIAMISDITTPETRSKGLALVGIAFALGFTFGPALGAYFASIDLARYVPAMADAGINSFSASAALSLILLVVETAYIAIFVKETTSYRPSTPSSEVSLATPRRSSPRLRRMSLSRDTDEPGAVTPVGQNISKLNRAHFLYLLFFSGAEFTLTFLTFDRFRFTNMQQGYLLGSVGILSSLIQGGYVRRQAHRIGEKKIILQGALAASISFLCVALVGTAYDPFRIPISTDTTFLTLMSSSPLMIVGGIAFAFASGTAINGMNSLVSLYSGIEYPAHQKGAVMGSFRSKGQLGRALGPLLGCSVYWLMGGVVSYLMNAVGALMAVMLIVNVSPPSKIKSKA